MGVLRNTLSGQDVKVAINRGELPEEDVRALFDALERKSAVDALINAWKTGDKISHAVIVRANTSKL
jgi:hypothetical protein